MTISRMGISSLMGYQDGGDVVDPLELLKQAAESNYEKILKNIKKIICNARSKKSSKFL